MSNTTSNRPQSVLILGATGGFGQALSRHMWQQGWQVKALTRNEKLNAINDSPLDSKSVADANAGAASKNNLALNSNPIEWVIGNLDNPASLQAAATGVDLIVHAVNVPYTKWDPLMLNYTRTIIELARDHHAHLMFVGNIYNAGLPENGLITESTAHAPVNDKGRIRAELEDMIAAAAETGVRSTIMRYGDFFGPDIPTSNWFNECTKDIQKNKLSMAGPADIPHTWAYLPDAVRALEQVAAIRLASNNSPNHVVVPFRGHVFSFAELQTTIERLTGNQLSIGRIPWGLFKVLGLVWPLMRDLVAMSYLWKHDIRMDNSTLTQLLGHEPVYTPLDEAVCATIPALRNLVPASPAQGQNLASHPAAIDSNDGAMHVA